MFYTHWSAKFDRDFLIYCQERNTRYSSIILITADLVQVIAIASNIKTAWPQRPWLRVGVMVVMVGRMAWKFSQDNSPCCATCRDQSQCQQFAFCRLIRCCLLLTLDADGAENSQDKAFFLFRNNNEYFLRKNEKNYPLLSMYYDFYPQKNKFTIS